MAINVWPTILGQRQALHQRSRFLGVVRAALRSALFRFLQKLLATDDARAMLHTTLAGAVQAVPATLRVWPTHVESPYPELGTSAVASQPSQRHDVVMITARFRTGSTLLWNLFRHLPGYTAYYEPLNERRWFDPATRGMGVDPTHRGAAAYWQEYEGLAELGRYYRASWADHQLFMDGDTWAPDLKRYVEGLIAGAAGRPVLQFNRIDFRLPWFRRHFPNAKIVHLYRHPRDQWCSTLLGSAFSPSSTVAEFVAADKFYLLQWTRDLKYQFPFLDERSAAHPYQLFYYVWKLSYWFGVAYAHYSLAFEDLVTCPDASLRDLFAALGVEPYDLDELRSLMEQPALGKWQEYASDAWFRSHEAGCETVLSEFFAERSS